MATPGQSLGEQRFPQTYAIRIVLAIVFLGLAALFIAVAYDQHPPEKTPLWIAVGLIAVCAVLWTLIGRTVLTINDFGVKRESVFGSQELRWAEIAEFRYRVTPINLAVHFGLVGALVSALSKSKNANLALTLKGDGKELKITSNFRKAKDAIAVVLNRVMPVLVKDVRDRIERGEKVAFGPVALSKTEIVWKEKTVIPINEVQQADLNGTNLRVKRTGKWLDAISIRSDKVPNVLVFLEILDGLAPQLKSQGIDPLARVKM